MPQGLWKDRQHIPAHGGLSHEGNHLLPAGVHPGPLVDLALDDAVDRVLAEEPLHPWGRFEHAHGIRRELLLPCSQLVVVVVVVVAARGCVGC